MNVGVMTNPYTLSENDAANQNELPRFTGKLMVPQWMNKAKMDKWHRYYEYRLGLNQIFKRQAEQINNRDVEVEDFNKVQ